jgi:enoyl-[acyl-carrier protein] reductase III
LPPSRKGTLNEVSWSRDVPQSDRRISCPKTGVGLGRGRIPGKDLSAFKRLTAPEDVARCITALCHPATYWLTGNTLYVDGGETMVG